MADLLLPPETASVSAAGDEAEAMARTAGWGAEDVDRVVLGTIEAMGNAVEHGPDRLIRLSFRLDAANARLTVDVADGGKGPLPKRLADPSLPDAEAEGGRGLYILHALADGLDVQDGVLRLTFVRRGGG